MLRGVVGHVHFMMSQAHHSMQLQRLKPSRGFAIHRESAPGKLWSLIGTRMAFLTRLGATCCQHSADSTENFLSHCLVVALMLAAKPSALSESHSGWRMLATQHLG